MGALCCVKCTGSNLQGTSLSGKPVDTAMLGFTERAAVGGREEREGGRGWMDGWMDGWIEGGRGGPLLGHAPGCRQHTAAGVLCDGTHQSRGSD